MTFGISNSGYHCYLSIHIMMFIQSIQYGLIIYHAEFQIHLAWFKFEFNVRLMVPTHSDSKFGDGLHTLYQHYWETLMICDWHIHDIWNMMKYDEIWWRSWILFRIFFQDAHQIMRFSRTDPGQILGHPSTSAGWLLCQASQRFLGNWLDQCRLQPVVRWVWRDGEALDRHWIWTSVMTPYFSIFLKDLL